MSSDLLLSRLQFAFTAAGHYLFVVLTLGLATLLALMETRALLSPAHRRAEMMRMVRFWGQLYVINYGMGIVTGLVMELQFGLVWPGLSNVAGEVFGVPLAVEGLVAFFLESTLLGLWIFGWDRLPLYLHTVLIWGIAITAHASSIFILLANGFLQHPVGVDVVGGAVHLTDFWAFITNPAALRAVPHIFFGSILAAGAVMAGLSAGQLRRADRRTSADIDLLRRSLKWGLVAFIIAIVPVAAFGSAQWGIVQPAKYAAYANDLQEMAKVQAESVARFGPGDYIPPAGWVRFGAYTMLGSWGLMAVTGAVGLVALLRRRGRALSRSRAVQLLLACATPLPFLAVLGGWTFREVGRQPWLIYQVLATSDAATLASHPARVFSFAAFVGTFAVLLTVNWWLLLRHVRRSPDAVSLGSEEPQWS